MVNIFHYHGAGTNGEPPFWWFKLVKLGIWAVLMLPLLFMRVSKDVKLLLIGTYGVLLLSYAILTVQFYYFLTIFPFFPLLITTVSDSSLKCKKLKACPLREGLVGAVSLSQMRWWKPKSRKLQEEQKS